MLIDATGSEGNAYHVMFKADKAMEQMGKTREEIELMLNECHDAESYEALCEAVKRHTDGQVRVYRMKNRGECAEDEVLGYFKGVVE